MAGHRNFALKRIEPLLAKTLDLELTAIEKPEFILDQSIGIFADGDLHRLGVDFHPRSHVHARAENIIDILLYPDDRADDRSGVNPDPAPPWFAMGRVSAFDIAAHSKRRPGRVLGMFRVGFR